MNGWVQRVLDLFDKPPAAVKAVPDPVAQQPSDVPIHSTSSRGGVPLPSEALDKVLPRAEFVHPRANRRIRLGATDVAYAFARGKRRTIGMAVGPDGLEVRAPRWVGLGEVESALLEKSDWINRKLRESQERQSQLGAARIDWRDGTVFPYLGEPIRLALDSGSALKRGSAQYEEHPAQEGNGQTERVLRLGLPTHAEPAQIRDAVQAWLMRQAKSLFVERLNHFAPLLGVQWQKLSLSSAATRWGSAGIDRTGRAAIRLNWRLVHHRLPVIDYVVAHELSHLRVMDHSPRFWETVESVMPDYAQRRRVLRDEPLPPWS